jgi:uncharacterized membrane protein YfcA
LFAAYRLFQYRQSEATDAVKPVPVLIAVFLGAGIGLLSGAVGVGGGIFLSPLLLFMGWARTKETAGVSAAYILVNSIAGISGHLVSVKFLPYVIYPWAFAAVLGGIIGSRMGSRRFVNATLYRLLAVVLVIAGAKLIFA